MVVYTLVYASLSGPAIDLQKMPILAKKKSSFRIKLKANLSHLGRENPYAYIEKPTHQKRVTVWCGFGPEA